MAQDSNKGNPVKVDKGTVLPNSRVNVPMPPVQQPGSNPQGTGGGQQSGSKGSSKG